MISVVSLYILDRNRYSQPLQSNADPLPGSNPYKGKKRVRSEEKIPVEVHDKFTAEIVDFVLYNVEDNEAVRNFEEIKKNTHCIFSKKAVLWGAQDYDKELSLGKLFKMNKGVP